MDIARDDYVGRHISWQNDCTMAFLFEMEYLLCLQYQLGDDAKSDRRHSGDGSPAGGASFGIGGRFSLAV
jgi:hypothetical protein